MKCRMCENAIPGYSVAGCCGVPCLTKLMNRCCERDHDGDGCCDQHPAKGRIAGTVTGYIGSVVSIELRRRAACMERAIQAMLDYGWKIEELQMVSVGGREAVVPKAVAERA